MSKKILFYFECITLSIRAIDLINMFNKHCGYDIYFFQLDDTSKFIFNSYNLNEYNIWDKTNINQFDIVAYDNTTWENGISELNSLVKNFKNKLVCVNYEDGQEFYLQNITNYTIDKTSLFINNALYVDRDKYPTSIKNKLFLTTSYITNSQIFRDSKPIFQNKKNRIYFTGSLTGNPSPLTNYSNEERYLRYNIVKRIYDNKSFNSYLKFYTYDPSYKEFFDNNIPPELKGKNCLSESEYISMMIDSMICIAVKGNSLPTNRLHEAQAAGCIAITNNFNKIVDIYGVGTNGTTFLEIDISLSDLEEKIEYCMNNVEFSHKIMKNSRENWERFNMLDQYGVYSEPTLQYHLEEFKKYNII